MASTLPFDLRSINKQSLFHNHSMANTLHKSRSVSPGKQSQHLAVFVHGLWGNTTHLNYVAESLRKQYDDQQLIVYSAKRNTGSLTYDGIEIGAERVAKEIEDLLEELGRDGHTIDRFSIIGYSLGGVVARYVVGLLDHKGYFEKMTPVNFTTFATPHLGVRTPLVGYNNHLWNVLGARLLSTSGRQLFLVDKFRDTGRPIFSVLADPESIFIQALSKFQNRSLYTNIVNDRSAVYYTTGIARTDPYTDLSKIKLNYLKGYENVLLDPDQPCERVEKDLPTFYQRVQSSSSTVVRRAPIVLALVILLPIAFTAFLLNSGVQTFRSRRRIMLHEQDTEGSFGVYQIPFMVQKMRVGLEDAFENVNSAQKQDYLPEGSEEMADVPPSPTMSRRSTFTDAGTSEKSGTELIKVTSERAPEFPTLALSPTQFAMINALDDVGFRKWPVQIHKSGHSHAAIIVRSPRAAFDDGKVVVRHWLEQDFKI